MKIKVASFYSFLFGLSIGILLLLSASFVRQSDKVYVCLAGFVVLLLTTWARTALLVETDQDGIVVVKHKFGTTQKKYCRWENIEKVLCQRWGIFGFWIQVVSEGRVIVSVPSSGENFFAFVKLLSERIDLARMDKETRLLVDPYKLARKRTQQTILEILCILVCMLGAIATAVYAWRHGFGL